jgi:chemotaxis signal transduction protein
MEALVFNAGGSAYLAPLAGLTEVLMPATLRPVPAAPPFLLGLLNRRGIALPVIDLGARLGLPPRAGFVRGNRILRVRLDAQGADGGDGADLGIAVDAVLGIVVLDAAARREATPGAGAGRHGRGPLWQLDGELIQELALQRLLGADELAALGLTPRAGQADFNGLLEQPAGGAPRGDTP